MTTQTLTQEELLDEKKAREIVRSIQRPKLNSVKVLNRVIHDLGLGDYTMYPGKITTCVVIPEKNIRIHIRRPDISTHDILRGSVPGKDQSVNLINNTIASVIKNNSIAQIDQSEFGLSLNSPVTVQHHCVPFRYEHILREYIAESDTFTSLWYSYQRGDREFCGHIFPDGLEPNQKLDRIYDTPSTKDARDESVSAQYLYDKKIVTKNEYEMILLPASLDAFTAVRDFLSKKNIILADTKIEFGKTHDGRYCMMDEFFTMDSSRFWLQNPDGSIMKKDGKPVSFSKQFARDMVTGAESLTEDQEIEIAVRYVISAQLITGQLFEPDTRDYTDIIYDDLEKVIKTIF